MHWVLYLAVMGIAGGPYPYHEQGAIKQFATKADCIKTLKVEVKELTAADGLLAGKKIGKDFTLVCKQEKN